ncbi:MAG: hypothetical protein SPC84_03380 [Oscillospiraceae bacterium]|nr:hypothetical protein [Oscillospiraceae bacterium]
MKKKILAGILSVSMMLSMFPTGAFAVTDHTHHWVDVPAKAATCTDDGYIEHAECDVEGCDAVALKNATGGYRETQAEEIVRKAAGHDYKQVAEKPATCSEKGIKAHLECSVCGEWAVENGTITEPVTDKSSLEIKMLDHDLEKVAAKEATCTEKGNIEYSKCKNCGKYFVEEGTITVEVKAKDVVIPAKGHTYKDVEEVSAICTSTGVKAHKECTECGKLFVEEGTILVETTAAELVIPASEHKLTDVPAKDATCEERGNIAYSKCELCGGLFKVTASGDVVAIEEKDTVKPAIDHFTRVIAEIEPTSCDKPGVKEHLVCENCGKLFLENATGGMREVTKEELVYNTFKHSMVAHKKVEPTCTEYGTMAYYECTSCGKLFKDAEGTKDVYATDLTLAPLGHSMTKHEEVKPTCTEAGTKEYYECETCGKIFADEKGETEVTEEDLVISAPGHSMSKHEEVKATCTEKGVKEYYECSVCGKIFLDKDGKTETTKDGVIVDALGHKTKFVAGVSAGCEKDGTRAHYECEVCGKLFDDAKAENEVSASALVISATGHHWGEWKVVKAATTKEAGIEQAICDYCGGPWQKEIPVKAASTISAPLYPTKDKRNSDVSSETKDETSSEIKDENDSTSKPDTKADSSDKTQEVGTTPDSSSAAQTENGSSFPIVPLVIAGAALIFLLILLKKRNKEE